MDFNDNDIKLINWYKKELDYELENKRYYIHYGSNKFDKKLFKPIKDINYNDVTKIPEGQTTKPCFGTGLWASAISSPINWRNLCYDYDFDNLKEIKDRNYFLFYLSKDANVIHIDHPDKLETIPHIRNVRGNEYNILFEEALKQGIDAIELHLENYYYEELDNYLFGWDCSSILILNPNIIIEESKIKPKYNKFYKADCILGYKVF